MKAILGLLSLLVVLGIVSMLAKKQVAPEQAQAVQALPQQVKAQVEATLQQPRPIPDDK